MTTRVRFCDPSSMNPRGGCGPEGHDRERVAGSPRSRFDLTSSRGNFRLDYLELGGGLDARPLAVVSSRAVRGRGVRDLSFPERARV